MASAWTYFPRIFKPVLFWILAVLPFLKANGQEWLPVKDIQSSVSVDMPVAPEFSRQPAFILDGPSTIQIFQGRDATNGVTYVLSSAKVAGVIKKKTEKKLLEEAILQIGVRHTARPVRRTGTQVQGRNALEVELLSSRNEQIQGLVLLDGSYIVTVYGLFREPDGRKLVERYLSTIRFPASRKEEGGAEEDTRIESGEWASLTEPGFRVIFPVVPFYQQQFILNGEVRQELKYWFANDPNSTTAYFLAAYEYPQPIVSPERLYNKATISLKEKFSANLILERPLNHLRFPAYEIVLESNGLYYRIRYYINGRTCYHLIVQGSEEDVMGFEVERFYNGFLPAMDSDGDGS